MNLVDKFKNGDIVINCNTKEQTAAFFNWCEENGIKITEQTRDYSFWGYKETVCYRCVAGSKCKLYYADVDFYTKNGFTVISYLDFFEKNTNTIKIKDIAKKYAEYKVDEDKLKELLIKPKLKTVWNLQVDDTYYYLTPCGDIRCDEWCGCVLDEARRAAGNCFLTREEVEFELERRKVEAELLKYGGTRDMMSIGDINTDKYFIMYLYESRRIFINSYCGLHCLGNIYFKSGKDAQRAINEVGEDRIKKYLFYVD